MVLANAHLLILAIICTATSSSVASAASYQKTDTSIVDPIQYKFGGGDHPYGGLDLEPHASAFGAYLVLADLSDADLHYADLEQANLSGAILNSANLSHAELEGAGLTETDLTNANLSFAGLFQADLGDAGLDDAVLTGADLSQAYLGDAYVLQTNLRYADLTDADLGYADVSGSDFSSADLTGAMNLDDTSGSAYYDANTIFAGTGFDPISAGWVLVSCGDGLIEGLSETCDDGGTTPGDGCDASCKVEANWACEGAPSVCFDIAIEWVTVEGAGNACDSQSQGCFGAVDYEYRISKFEITNAQYADFLNSVATTDTNALYSTDMAVFDGGITRSGITGTYSYSTIGGRGRMPAGFVTFWQATRFANWLHNGKPTGAQNDSTTEDGAYTLTPAGISNNTVARNAGAAFFLPSEDEWYKAAYYDPGTMTYFDFPAGSDTQTTCTSPGAMANTANCSSAVGDFTDVGSYTGAASPSGTYDQGGNIWEWNEAIITGYRRVVRGDAYVTTVPDGLAAWFQHSTDAANDVHIVGIRVASPISEPPVSPLPSLSPLGLALISSLLGSVGVLGITAKRRGRI